MNRKQISKELFMSMIKLLTSKNGYGIPSMTIAKQLGVTPMAVYYWKKGLVAPRHDNFLKVKSLIDSYENIFGVKMGDIE